ncbi:hypothetical protein HMI55_003528, partial [Coelomomyces lativittatus]
PYIPLTPTSSSHETISSRDHSIITKEEDFTALLSRQFDEVLANFSNEVKISSEKISYVATAAEATAEIKSKNDVIENITTSSSSIETSIINTSSSPPSSESLPSGLAEKYKGESITENPVKSIHDYCSIKRLPQPKFEDIGTPSSKQCPIPLFGMKITVCNKEFFTPTVYTSKREAKAAASLLGLNSLGFPSINVDEIYSKKPPEPVIHKHGSEGTPKVPSGDCEFAKLLNLIQRQGLIPPTFSGHCISHSPSQYKMTFTFLGQTFEGIGPSKAEARKVVSKKASEYLSKHKDFAQPPTDFTLLMAKYCSSKQWPSPRYFDPKDELKEELPSDKICIAVVINGHTFVKKLGSEYTQQAAKRAVAKKAYEYFLSLEAKASSPADPTASEMEAADFLHSIKPENLSKTDTKEIQNGFPIHNELLKPLEVEESSEFSCASEWLSTYTSDTSEENTWVLNERKNAESAPREASVQIAPQEKEKGPSNSVPLVNPLKSILESYQPPLTSTPSKTPEQSIPFATPSTQQGVVGSPSLTPSSNSPIFGSLNISNPFITPKSTPSSKETDVECKNQISLPL